MKYVEKIVQWGDYSGPYPTGNEFHVYVKNGVPLMVDFLCPCGCGHTVPTYLIVSGEPVPTNFPHWSYSTDPNGPTLSPSIRFLSGCKAHFNITDGEAIIHADSGK